MSQEKTAAALAASANLQRVGTRPPLGRYFVDVYRRRSFALTMAKYQMQASTAKSRLGVAWHVVVPALQILVYGLIFGLVLGDNRPDNFLPYLIVGVVLFQFISGAFADGAKAIISNASLVRSLNFPRVLLPVSSVMANVYKIVPLLALMLIGLVVMQQPITWQWLLLIPVMVLVTLFGLGLAMISARLTVSFADLGQMIPFLTRVAFYASGVFFDIEKLLQSTGWLLTIFANNPIHIYLKLARAALVDGYSASSGDWILASAWSVALLVAGFVFFWRAEARYGRNV